MKINKKLYSILLASIAMILMLVSIAGAAPYAYITNCDDRTVSVIDTATNNITATVTVGSSPSAFGQFIGLIPASEPVLPVASFSTNTTSGYASLSVQFNDSSLNATFWSWNFGDGESSTEQNPSHIYASSGNYTVNLTVTNTAGTNTSSRPGYILVAPHFAPVTAAFSGTPMVGTAPLTVTFTDASTGSPTGWAWFFGDESYTQAWTEQNASSGWSKRSEYTSVAMPDGSIVLMGGYDGTNLNDTWRSTDYGVTWTLVNASSGWSGRYGHTSVVTPDGTIVLMGGWNGTYLNDTWTSTDYGATWMLMNPSCGWSARIGHTSVAMPAGLLLMGGWDGSSGWNDTWTSTDKGATWTLVNASSGWSQRSGHTSVVTPDGTIVLMDGTSDHEIVYDVWKSEDYGATWTLVNEDSLPPDSWASKPARGSLAMPDGSILLMGGDGVMEAWNDLWRSTDYGETWTLVNEDCGWPGRTSPNSVAMPDGSIVLMGSRHLNDTWRLQPSGSSLQSSSHTYEAPGTYPVTLQVFNTGGSTRATGQITVTAPLPTAEFTGRPTSGTSPLTVDFADASSGSPTGWAWFFGDEVYTQAWTEQTMDAEWSGIVGSSIVKMPDGSIVLMGGYDDTFLNETWLSTDYGKTWTLVNASSGWSGRFGHSSVVMPDGTIVLMGGTAGYENVTVFNDTWQSTDYGRTWTQVNTGSGWSGRYFSASVAMPDGTIVLMGGRGESRTLKNDVWQSADKGKTWTLVNANPGWSERSVHTVVATPDGTIVLMGGWDDNSVLNDTWKSVDNGKTWTLVNANSGWPGREAPAAVVMPDDSILLMGGSIDDYNCLNDTWRSTDDGATWTLVNANCGWPARVHHSCFAMPDGSVVLIGGWDYNISYNDNWRLQPAGSSLQSPSHTYTAPGTYTVTLQAFNAGEYTSTRKTGYVFVLPAAEISGGGSRHGSGSGSALIISDTSENVEVNGSPAKENGTTIQFEKDTEYVEQDTGNEPAKPHTTNEEITGKSISGFEMIYGTTCLFIVFLYKRRRDEQE